MNSSSCALLQREAVRGCSWDIDSGFPLNRAGSMSSPEIHFHKPTSHYQSAKALAECRVKASRTELLPPYTAVEYALARNRSEAFKWLSNACDQHDDWLSYLKMDPAFDSLRSDPKSAVLVRRVGLPSL